MPIAPGVTLTANAKSILGNAALLGFLRITLCGYGPVLPAVSGVTMLADAGIPLLVGPASAFSEVLWGNDVITPPNTFYEVAVLDQDENVIQAGLYQFLNNAGAVDLSQAAQIVGPFGFKLGGLSSQACAGALPGSIYTAPGTIVALFLNGILLPRGQALPVLSYTGTAAVATLNFVTVAEDRIDALCIL